MKPSWRRNIEELAAKGVAAWRKNPRLILKFEVWNREE